MTITLNQLYIIYDYFHATIPLYLYQILYSSQNLKYFDILL